MRVCIPQSSRATVSLHSLMSVATRNPTRRASRAAVQAATIPPWPMRVFRQFYQPGLLFPLAVALGVIVTWPYLPRWAPDLSSDPAYQVTVERVHIPERHEWVPFEIVERVLARAGATPERPLSLLRDRLSAELAESFAAEPWVKAVREVRRERDGTIKVDLEFRRPALMVSTPRGMYAVDAEAVLLPPQDFRAEDIPRFPLARGATSLPQVGAGQAWNDPVILGAARLAEFLTSVDEDAAAWSRLGLAAIVLPGRESAADRLPSYELETAGGSRIVWGDAPGAESLEPSPKQKLARLIYYREQCGGFETAEGPARIDIRDIEVIYAGALEEQRR